MRKNVSIILGSLFCCYFTAVDAQILYKVEKVRQSQTFWCWAGVSKCVLKYYGKDQEQCTIAEYAREMNPKKFGVTNCCDANHSCNQPNGMYGVPGTINDILIHFGSIKNNGQASILDKATVSSELQNNRPFIFRWGWMPDWVNGHFMVGYGLQNGVLYYMDPDKDEGFQFSKYEWVVMGGRHKWTHTIVLKSNVGVPEPLSTNREFIYPNPTSGKISFKEMPVPAGTMIEILNSSGKLCFSKPFPASGELDLSGLQRGMYILRIITNDQSMTAKLILQ